MFEGEHAPGAGEAALDLVDDQRHTRLLGDAAYAFEPFDIGRNHPALALHYFEDHCGR
ncbi:hypothetical protein D3C77_788390 [compost metagenome]